MSLIERLRIARSVVRSLRIYYGGLSRRKRMQRLYASFVQPGDLTFDVGAHVGDRTAAFRALGAKVIAVEPQPAFSSTLWLLYCFDRLVVIEPVAVGRTSSSVCLKLNLDNPTVSTASDAFIAAASNTKGWEDQVWSQGIDVPMTTLDALIARHGMPSFIKLDLEGFEAEALTGLSKPVAALSFEFTTMQRGITLACLDRCEALGYRRFNAAIGESQVLVHPDWQPSDTMRGWLLDLPDAANSGDIYARLS